MRKCVQKIRLELIWHHSIVFMCFMSGNDGAIYWYEILKDDITLRHLKEQMMYSSRDIFTHD